MALWKPDPTFYASPRDAAAAPPEKLAYVAAFDRAAAKPDAIAVLDVAPDSGSYGSVVGWTDLPHLGDELHHFGWNACSSALCPGSPHPHAERRYLIVPGLRSSRVYVIDTKDDPASPKIIKTLEPVIQPFGAVPPLVTDIDLSVDDQWLYVSCWGTGELKRYDVSDPFKPVEAGSVRIGGIVDRTPHPADPGRPLAGGPQMVEVSRDGKRVYVTNSLYGSWDDQFYTDGFGAWMAKLDSSPESFTFDERFLPNGDAFRGLRHHQTRLQGGDASSDSYCYP